MPVIFLSPSTQEYNPWVIGGDEEYYMNLIADAMIPYLDASGIRYIRNTRDMTAASSTEASNAAQVDAHIALHSNAAPDFLAGKLAGPDVYFFPRSYYGRRLAEIVADGLREIYPRPSLVDIRPTTVLREVAKTTAPAVLIEFAYHDNEDDAFWMADNINEIARNVVQSLTRYFGIPFKEP